MTSLAAEERRAWLHERLQFSQRVSLAEAAAELGVSEMTVRRDLNDLERNGGIRRVRGGAVYTGPVSFQGRERSFVTEKAAIATKLLPLVPASGVIAMDSSTTMHRLAQVLTGAGDLVVVTNGLLTFQALQERPGITPILTGGAADRRSDSLIGPVATAFLENMQFDAFFASTAAIDARGCHEDTLEEAEVKRAFARSSLRVIVGAHGQKLGNAATAASIPLKSILTLATELKPMNSALSTFAELITDIR